MDMHVWVGVYRILYALSEYLIPCRTWRLPVIFVFGKNTNIDRCAQTLVDAPKLHVPSNQQYIEGPILLRHDVAFTHIAIAYIKSEKTTTPLKLRKTVSFTSWPVISGLDISTRQLLVLCSRWPASWALQTCGESFEVEWLAPFVYHHWRNLDLKLRGIGQIPGSVQ